jgi:hypothetical protein
VVRCSGSPRLASKRIEGVSSEWTLSHVRAGQETVEKEIASAGFKKAGEVKDLLKDNYVIVFTKVRGKS